MYLVNAPKSPSRSLSEVPHSKRDIISTRPSGSSGPTAPLNYSRFRAGEMFGMEYTRLPSSSSRLGQAQNPEERGITCLCASNPCAHTGSRCSILLQLDSTPWHGIPWTSTISWPVRGQPGASSSDWYLICPASGIIAEDCPHWTH